MKFSRKTPSTSSRQNFNYLLPDCLQLILIKVSSKTLSGPYHLQTESELALGVPLAPFSPPQLVLDELEPRDVLRALAGSAVRWL